jgi:hypothetical protein
MIQCCAGMSILALYCSFKKSFIQFNPFFFLDNLFIFLLIIIIIKFQNKLLKQKKQKNKKLNMKLLNSAMICI